MKFVRAENRVIANLLKAMEEQQVLDTTLNLKDLIFEDMTTNSNLLHFSSEQFGNLLQRVAPLIQKEDLPTQLS